MRVNSEMLQFYWSIGRDISQMELTAKYGSGFYKKLSSDLKAIFPDSSSFSETNLRYMWRFYELYPLTENLPQLGANFDNENLPQLVANSDDYKNIFLIPWGHHKVIIDKCRGEQQKALFYVNKVIENNWSRAVLLNFLDTGLYDRQGKAITNFQATLHAVQSDLAQAITKDPYNFHFLTLTEKYNEKELKDALRIISQGSCLNLAAVSRLSAESTVWRSVKRKTSWICCFSISICGAMWCLKSR